MNAHKVNVTDDFNIKNDDDKAVLNSFIDHTGLIEVKIHIGNKSLEIDEELSFEMVFTSFQGS